MSNNANDMRIILSDKMAVIQVLGGLINNPLLLTNSEYNLKTDDFPERFHTIVFGAIEYLASQGLEKIAPIDIDQFLIRYDVQYKIFTDNQGLNYLIKCTEVADPKKFSFYYNVLKKYSLLYKLYQGGFNIKEILDPYEPDPAVVASQRAKFDNMTIEDILAIFETRLITITQNFEVDNDIIECEAGKGLSQLVESFKDTPDIGMPCLSPKCTTLFRGQRLKKLHIESSFTGGGKSRKALGEAAHLAIPQYYDTKNNKWVNTGLKEGVLYISIELQPDELQTMLLAYVTGISENVIRDGVYGKEEQERISKAIEYINRANFHFVCIGDFDMDDIEKIIKKHKQLYNTRYIYFDYVTASIKMLANTSGKARIKNMREDQVLLDACARLKKMANQFNLHIHTATQLNREWKKEKEIDTSVLRGGFGIGDKADVGFIILPPREEDEPAINEYMRKGFTTRPNLVLHIYKVRQARTQKLKLFIYFDYGTCRLEDCFATDKNGNFLDIEDTNVEIILEQTKEEEKPKKEEFVF